MADEKKTEVTISPVSQSFPRTMIYNRAGIERLGPTFVFYFGLLDENYAVLDSYACAVDEDTVRRHKEEILSYVSRASSESPPELDSWRGELPRGPYAPSPLGRVDLANVMLIARIGPIAELRFYNFAMGDVLEAPKIGKKTVEGFPVALLRCELQLQRSMFLYLYSTIAAKPKK